VAGIDYNETKIYAPVVKHDSLRILLFIATALVLELMQLEVTTAFLYGYLDEELYVQLPKGFIKPGKEKIFRRLLIPLYGLKEAPRKLNEKFDCFVVLFGLTRSTADPCMYFCFCDDPNDLVVIGLWVDDCLTASKSKAKALAIVTHLERFFEMTSGSADCFIGLEITRDCTRKKRYLTQSIFIEKLIIKFWMNDCNLPDVPAEPCSRLIVVICQTGANFNISNSTSYRALVGALLYIMGLTSPDIAFAVIAFSRCCQNPGPTHWKASKHILAYLLGTINYGLCCSDSDSSNVLRGFTDSDFAGCPNTRHSTTSVLYQNQAPVTLKFRLQKLVAQSTAES
jgi:hypothetical protein